MSKELVIASNRHETKVAVLEDDQLVEIYFQRANEYSLAGSIHKGRVTRVLPGMQSAFVDLGLERDTFLYVSDFFEEHEDIDTVVEDRPSRGERRERGNRGQSAASERQEFKEREREPEPGSEPGPHLFESNGADTQLAEDESGAAAGQVAAETGTEETSEGRSVERGEAGRDFRGDRRNRRSRRRRQRGRGFPENKYAQPSAIASPVAGAREEIEEAPDEARDVIILLGESLANYRHMSPGPEEPSSPESRESEGAEEPVAGGEEIPPGVPTDPAEQEAIEEEAEEIELTEKVFGHYEDPADLEEAIEEAKQDQPAPLAPSNEEELNSAGATPLTSGYSQPHVPVEPTAPNEFAVNDDVGTAPQGEPIETNELEALEAEEPAEPAEPEAESEGSEMALAEEPGQPQSASVREQGGRYMHRISRRMRRRRGGNRLGQSAEFVTGASGGAGAAAALEAESKRRP